MRDDAPQLHEEYPNNILKHTSIRQGSYEEAIREPGLIKVEGWYDTFVSNRVRYAIRSHIVSWVRPDGTFAARKLMSGHLCRCTGYENIFRAVKKTLLRRLGETAGSGNRQTFCLAGFVQYSQKTAVKFSIASSFSP